MAFGITELQTIDDITNKYVYDGMVIHKGASDRHWHDVTLADRYGKEITVKVGSEDKRPYLLEKVVDEGFTLEKALNITGFSAQLIPVYVDQDIVNTVRKEAPLVELIPRVATRGKSVDFNRLTALGTTGFKAEDAELSEANDTYVRKSINVGYLYQVGRVTGPFQAAAEQYVDGMNIEVMNKTTNLKYIEEQSIIVGNTVMSTGGVGDDSTAAPWNSQAYPGLLAQQKGMTTAAGITNPWTTSANVIDVAGGNLSISHIRQAIEEAKTDGGRPKFGVTDLTTERQLKGLVGEFQRINDTTRFAWGIEALTIDGLPIITSKYMSRTTQKKEILIVDTDVVEMRVLQDTVFERLAKTNDSDKFYLKQYQTLINKAPEFSALIEDYL